MPAGVSTSSDRRDAVDHMRFAVYHRFEFKPVKFIVFNLLTVAYDIGYVDLVVPRPTLRHAFYFHARGSPCRAQHKRRRRRYCEFSHIPLLTF
jgi:hypothetical protein